MAKLEETIDSKLMGDISNEDMISIFTEILSTMINEEELHDDFELEEDNQLYLSDTIHDQLIDEKISELKKQQQGCLLIKSRLDKRSKKVEIRLQTIEKNLIALDEAKTKSYDQTFAQGLRDKKYNDNNESIAKKEDRYQELQEKQEMVSSNFMKKRYDKKLTKVAEKIKHIKQKQVVIETKQRVSVTKKFNKNTKKTNRLNQRIAKKEVIYDSELDKNNRIKQVINDTSAINGISASIINKGAKFIKKFSDLKLKIANSKKETIILASGRYTKIPMIKIKKFQEQRKTNKYEPDSYKEDMAFGSR